MNDSGEGLVSVSSSDILPRLFSPIDPVLSSIFTNITTDFDFFASTVSSPMLETSDSNILGQSHFYSIGGSGSSSSKTNFNSNGVAVLLTPQDAFSAFEEAVSELPNLPMPYSPLNSRASATSDEQSDQGYRISTDSSC